jgi:hypothetical protein
MKIESAPAVTILLLAGGAGWGAPGWALAVLWLLSWAVLFRSGPAPGTIGAVPWVALPLLVVTIAALHDARAQRRQQILTAFAR